MRKMLIYLILITSICFGQGRGWSLAEIFIITEGMNPNTSDSLRFKLEALSIVWKANCTYPFSNYEITNDYNISYYPKAIYGMIRNSPNNYYQNYDVWGFNFICTGNEATPNDMDSYSWGLYKLSAIYKDELGSLHSRASIFLDFRDCRFPGYPAPS
jgi:hypothetical protein